jgi:hypothetical protein
MNENDKQERLAQKQNLQKQDQIQFTKDASVQRARTISINSTELPILKSDQKLAATPNSHASVSQLSPLFRKDISKPEREEPSFLWNVKKALFT